MRTWAAARARIQVVAAVENASLEARVERAVEQAIAARRADLEHLVRSRVDVALQELAGEVLDQQLAQRCTSCGGFPTLPSRTLCRDCHRARARELHAARVVRRRNGGTPADDEEPHPAPADLDSKSRREPVRSPESAPNGAAGVSESGGGIAAEELARRAGARNLPGLSAGELEAWLLGEGLARVTSAGLLVPTERTAAIAGALAS
jgi:hypothetical protein